jgi:hypothetical protein
MRPVSITIVVRKTSTKIVLIDEDISRNSSDMRMGVVIILGYC